MEETITSAPLLAFCAAGVISLMILAVLLVRKKLTIFEGMTFFAPVIAAATAVFVFNQVDAMRKDQRPWVRVSMDFAPIQESNPITSGTMQILNSGKTPAKSVNGTFFVEKVVNGDEPTFMERKPFATMTTGIKFPNIAIEHQLIVHPILQPELADLKAGKIFLWSTEVLFIPISFGLSIGPNSVVIGHLAREHTLPKNAPSITT